MPETMTSAQYLDDLKVKISSKWQDDQCAAFLTEERLERGTDGCTGGARSRRQR